MKQTIDTYRLTSMEEPTEAFLSQIMRDQLRQAAAKVDA